MSDLHQRARTLKLHGLLAHWDEVAREPWIENVLQWEETERSRRGLERRMRQARLGAFKPLEDFDWTWPKKIDRLQIEELFELKWLHNATNVVLVGPNGVGKTLLAKNLTHQAILAGATARCLTASELLNTLAEQDSSRNLQQKLGLFTQPQLLTIDELGYLSYDHRHADLLFEIVSRRYTNKSIVLTTNKPFAEWNEVFPNASCVVTLVDRLVHHAEIVQIDADSYRLKEAQAREAERAARRKTARRKARAAS